MGLIKKDGVEIRGVLIQPAYARLISLGYHADPNELNTALFGISNSRENLTEKGFISTKIIDCIFDASADNLLQEAYTQAKIKYFTDWEDDIVTIEDEKLEEE